MIKDIFSRRDTVEPIEYPQLLKFMEAIQASFWIPSHFTYDRDVLDYKVKLNESEQNVVKNCMLAIGVVENKVKTSWARLDLRMPKPEISMVGYTFASNEVIHQLTYKTLLELLGLEREFITIDNVDCMKGRSEYLGKYLKGYNSNSDKEFIKSLILFALLIENATLFSQFYIMASFSKRKKLLTNFNAVVGATAREEDIHAKFGAELINIVRREHPEWFDAEMEDMIRKSVFKAWVAELKVIDWIFEKGDLDFITKNEVEIFLMDRFNQGLRQIGYTDQFGVDEDELAKTEWFNVQMKASASFDFFNEKSTDYSQNKAFNEDNLWD